MKYILYSTNFDVYGFQLDEDSIYLDWYSIDELNNKSFMNLMQARYLLNLDKSLDYPSGDQDIVTLLSQEEALTF